MDSEGINVTWGTVSFADLLIYLPMKFGFVFPANATGACASAINAGQDAKWEAVIGCVWGGGIVKL